MHTHTHWFLYLNFCLSLMILFSFVSKTCECRVIRFNDIIRLGTSQWSVNETIEN